MRSSSIVLLKGYCRLVCCRATMGESLAQQLKAKKENDIRSVMNRLNILFLLVSAFAAFDLFRTLRTGRARQERYGREAAAYIDRILKGSNPSDLPVQLPTKFHIAIN